MGMVSIKALGDLINQGIDLMGKVCDSWPDEVEFKGICANLLGLARVVVGLLTNN